MPRDLKTGMALGLVVIAVVVSWIATRPRLSTAMLNYRSARTANVPSAGNGGSPGSEHLVSEAPTGRHDLPTQPAQEAKTAAGGTELGDSPVYEQREKITTERFHIVRKGETLSDISYQYYGSSRQWQKIVEANSNTIKEVNKVRPGTKLIIPQ